jgi:hypothetical protein
VLSRWDGDAAYFGAYATASAPSQSSGAGSSASLTISADTVNQGLNPTVTVPNGHTWRCEAPVSAAEIQ